MKYEAIGHFSLFVIFEAFFIASFLLRILLMIKVLKLLNLKKIKMFSKAILK